MNNLEIYEACRAVPNEAKKPITGGRLNGKTDINPMWRIKKLTETFGPCGIGWWYEISGQWLERYDNGEIAAFCDIQLYYKWGNEVSKPIPGTGGSMFAVKEKNGIYVDDEAYKKALTDAISVACKAIGIGADVYWGADASKYDKPKEAPPKLSEVKRSEELHNKCERCGKGILSYKGADGKTVSIEKHCKGSKAKFGQVLCLDCIEIINIGGNTNA